MSAASDAARALPAMLRVGFASAVAYRSEFLIWILSTNMPLVMLALWSAVARDAPVGRFGESRFRAYFLSALVVRLLTGSWVLWEMNYEVRQGTLGMRLLRPIHPFVSYASDNLAAVPMRLLISLPLTAGALLWVGGAHLTRDPVQWLAFPLSVAGAWAITFTSMVCVGSLALYFESALAVYDLWLALFFVFSGYIVPLELFPPALYRVVRWLPFRYQLSFPVETALGLAPRSETLVSLGVQWAYALGFLGLALALWRRGLRRFAAYGG